MHHLVYYVGLALKDDVTRYSPLEKIVFTLITTIRKLLPYFQAHHVQLMPNQPLVSVLQSPTCSG